MHKKIAIPITATVAILGGVIITNNVSILNNATAEQKADTAITNGTLTQSPIISNSKNETVFVMTDENGSTKSKFIGNTIYDGPEELPFDFKITYYLDNQEVSANDLIKKSGHVKIIYSYESTVYYQNKKVPFLAVTGLTLDRNIFSNLKINNGKIINESADSYIIAGYSFIGLNQDLGTDFLPDSFTIEADVTDFKLGNSYTLLTNDIIADMDTSKLSSVENLANSINELSNGLEKILDGATALSDGLYNALSGTQTLYAGSQSLTEGLNELVSHNEELTTGAEQIAALTPDIAELLQDKKDSLIEQKTSLEENLKNIPDLEPYAEIRAQIIAGIAQIDAGVNKIDNSLSKLSDLKIFYQGLVDYTNGVAEATNGATALSAGLGTLVNGETELYNGSVALKDGLTTFKTTGIDKLVDFANKDVKDFTYNVRSTVNAAASYKSYGNTDAKSVKFIVKTPSI